MNEYKKNKNWTIFKEEDNLFITKGADEIYLFDEVAKDDVDKVLNTYKDENFDKIDDNLLKKLESAGVIYKNKHTSSKKIKISYKIFGSGYSNLEKSLNKSISNRENIAYTKNIEECDLLLIIRTNTKLKNVLEGYEDIKKPHLFIDLGYSNVLSIGPLVFKNETACLGCYIGRLTKNWGDLEPPTEPEVLNKHELISLLILEKIEEYRILGNCPDLVNGVWNYNFNTSTTKLDRIYKLPWCPLCNEEKENSKIDFPWIGEL